MNEFQKKLKNLIERLSEISKEKFKTAPKGTFLPFFYLCALSYVLSSIFSSLIAGVLLGIIGASSVTLRAQNQNVIVGGEGGELNYMELQKMVLDRNLFNSTGELPDESSESAAQSETAQFSDAQPCSKVTLNLELRGIIFVNSKGRSLVTLQEKGYTEVDVYTEGETILGQEGVIIHRITADSVVFNNRGKKECFEVEKPKLPDASEALDYTVTSNTEATSAGPKPAQLSPECSVVSLTESYVREELGDGFSKMVDNGRLVPHTKDGNLIGFKLIGVRSGTIFSKLCLKSGDVITDVNGTSLSQADQAFVFYEVFQNERDIRIQFLQNGENPASMSVRVQ